MRKQYHWSLKLLALVLAMLSAAGLALGGASFIFNVNMGLYDSAVDLDQKIQSNVQDQIDCDLYEYAMKAASDYVLYSYTEVGTVERDLWQNWFNSYYTLYAENPGYAYEIRSTAGVELANGGWESQEYAMTDSRIVSVQMGNIVNLGPDRKEFPLFEDWEGDYVWTDVNGDPLPDVSDRAYYYDLVYDGSGRVYRIEFFDDLSLEVIIHLTQAQVDELTEQTSGVMLLRTCYRFRGFDIGLAVISAIGLILSTIYLCFAAGKKPGCLDIRPRGTNRLPLDLFFTLECIAVTLLLALGFQALEQSGWVTSRAMFRLWVAVYGLCAMGLGLACELFLTAFFAQVRMGKWAWLKRTIAGRCWLWCWGLCKKLWKRIFGKALNAETAEKAVGLIPKAAHWIRGAYRTLPLMWQWLGLFGVLLLITLWVASTFRYHSGTAFLLVAVVGFLIVLYTGYGFGRLRDAAKRMSEGDLDTKIDCYGEFLYGNFAEFAEDLNALGDTCVDAALARMKSERMRSELITNVSHDIKTPLTSIINYVDLLQKAETEEQRKEYLEVLDRQSQRLKKLIEDLMEMSKASSGNVAVELAENDIIEAVNQALGEFSDRFQNLNLQILFRQADQSIQASFDGKLLWRVLSNLLGNVCKYALPGTRVYVDVEVTDQKVLLSIKNISREPLNIPADELMERFVRGDTSRNDQGNGLGLNIARGLMQAQGGDLALTVDGDLFKVILTLN